MFFEGGSEVRDLHGPDGSNMNDIKFLSAISNLPKNAIVMHPLPRAGEIPVLFDNDPRAKYFEQIKNGLLVRKALLRELLA